MPIKFAVKMVRQRSIESFLSPMTLLFTQCHNCVSNLTKYNLYYNSNISGSILSYKRLFENKKLGSAVLWLLAFPRENSRMSRALLHWDKTVMNGERRGRYEVGGLFIEGLYL